MEKSKNLISLIVPVHNEQGNLEWFHDQLTNAINVLDHDFEIIYVNDGSRDDSLRLIKSIADQYKNVHYISFSRNFGKEAATSAGLRRAEGQAAIMIDADGQHPPELIHSFIQQWQEGSQVVIGVRSSNTREGLVKRYGSKVFYRLLNAISDGETIPRSTDFRLIDRRVIDEFNSLTEHNRITRGLIDWLGFNRSTVEFKAAARHHGPATYGFRKLVRLALHAFVSQTTKPLQFTGFLGGIVVILSALVGVFLIIEKYALGDPLGLAVTGTALLALFVSFLVGLVLISNWLLALYVESIHSETQNRPLFVVAEEDE